MSLEKNSTQTLDKVFVPREPCGRLPKRGPPSQQNRHHHHNNNTRHCWKQNKEEAHTERKVCTQAIWWWWRWWRCGKQWWDRGGTGRPSQSVFSQGETVVSNTPIPRDRDSRTRLTCTHHKTHTQQQQQQQRQRHTRTHLSSRERHGRRFRASLPGHTLTHARTGRWCRLCQYIFEECVREERVQSAPSTAGG